MLIGLVGKPSSGKSTFFQASTEVPVERANYPFTTIEPNRGIAYARVECVDREFGVECNPRTGFCKEGIRFVPVELMDVAGLVPGAHEGKGLGNRFLDDLRRADILMHIVDASGSTNERGEYVGAGRHDPLKDIEFLENEIDMWMAGMVERNLRKLKRIEAEESTESALGKQFAGLGIGEDTIKRCVQDGFSLRDSTEEERKETIRNIRKAGKPIMVVANKADIESSEENIKKMEKVCEYVVPCSAESELMLKTAARKGYISYIPGDDKFNILKEPNEQQKKALDTVSAVMKKFGGTGVQKAIDTAVFDILKMIAVFPGGVSKLADKDGNVLPDVVLLKSGSTAIDFAEAVHKELAEGFIKAIDVRTKKALGKEFKLRHRDVIEIVSRT